MTLALDTGHALYGNLVAFVCVDGAALKDLVTPSRTFTVAGGASFGSGALGEHLQTTVAGGAFSPTGAAIDTAIPLNTTTTSYTLIGIFNDVVKGQGAGTFLGTTGNGAPDIKAADPVTVITGCANYDGTGVAGTTNVSTGSHMISVTRPSGDMPTGNLYVDGGASEATITNMAFGGGAGYSYIGGASGAGSFQCKAVYVIVLNKVCSEAELAALHSSLTGSKVFAMLAAAGQTGTVARTQAPNVSAAAGTVSSSGITGTAARTQAANVAAAAGTVTAGGSASFTTDIMMNNTNTAAQVSVAVQWNWFPGWRIGDAIPGTTYRGSGTSSGTGTYQITGLPSGAGGALVTVRGATAADDATYIHFGTAA
jgi:hypothetical protein